MAGPISSIFGGGGGRRGPSPEEIARQKRQERLERIKAAKKKPRTKQIGAGAAAGTINRQTLFERPGSIPRPKKLGGGSQT